MDPKEKEKADKIASTIRKGIIVREEDKKERDMKEVES